MTVADTITAQFQENVSRLGHSSALLERQGAEWVSQSFAEWDKRSRAAALSLMEDGIKPGDSVAIFSYSRREWLEADMAILMTGGRTATIYQNIAGETADYIIRDAAASVVFAEGPVQLRAIFGDHGNRQLPPCLKRIVYFQNRQIPPQRPGRPPSAEISLEEAVPPDRRDMLVSFDDYVRAGRALKAKKMALLDARIEKLAPDDIAKIVYTSGTTGQPKGSLLSHRNLSSVTEKLSETIGIRQDDTTLLFLPLAHVYAQLVYHAQMRIGFRIAFARSMLTAVEDAQSLRPDFFVSVPRLFEKIHSTVLARVASSNPIRKGLFEWATDVGRQVSQARQHKRPVSGTLAIKATLADKLVFSKLKQSLGGKVRFMVSGGAPLQQHIMEFFHAADLLILEGYGMTENGSLSNHNRISDYRFGTVGKVIDNTSILIADDGEILIKGPGVMKGYLNLPEETARTIDEAGWLHTGDIGEIDADGFLKITDRKKDLIVTSGGKNIPPAPIEAMLSRIPLVSQSVVFGNRRKYLTALVTIDMDAALALAQERGIASRGEALAKDKRILQALEAEIETINQTLESYETIKRFAILPREFSIDQGEVTPSLKLRKKVIENRYKDLVDSLYPKES